MPDAATAAYLAKHYLDGAKADALLARSGQSSSDVTTKKRKKKRPEQHAESSKAGSQGLRMVDDADETWKRSQLDEDDEDAIVMPSEEDAARAKRKRWNRLGADGKNKDGEQRETTSTQQHGDAEEASSKEAPSSSKPSFRPGLKTREEMRAERLERERRAAEQSQEKQEISAEQRAAEEERKQREREAAQGETIYRDAQGKRVDMRAVEEEQRQAEEDKRRRERERQDWNKGEAQLRQARETRQREEQVRAEGVTRYANDARMNQELRQRERAVADPAAAFLSSKSKAQQGPRMPVYKGSFPPNRFGIRPGYRWDGVERGNGFEAKLFQRRNERSVRQAEERAWRQEDM